MKEYNVPLMTQGDENDEDLTSRYELDSNILITDGGQTTGRDFKAMKASNNTF